MKIGIPLQSLTYPLQRVMGRNREVDLRPLKFTKMLEPTLSSGYHGAFSCTRDIRYPYRKKKDLFFELSIKLHTFVLGGFRGGPRGSHLLFFRWNFVLILWGIFIKIKFQVSLPAPPPLPEFSGFCPCLYEPLLTLTSVNVLVSTVKICVANQLILSLQ